MISRERIAMSGEGRLVCVTGASGYTASCLVKLLLLRGYTVHGTVRDLTDPIKVDHLLALQGAKERLRLFQAELMEDGSFDAPIEGCHGVFHTASPCALEFNDPQAEVLDPAIRGTINVLNSCNKYSCTIKRVVLTSSIGAMVFNEMPSTQVDETCWSDPHFCRREEKWYAESKTVAEMVAWEFAKEKGIDLVTICPGWTLGPMLQPTLNLSSGVILNLVETHACPDGGYGWVNVKDVATAHVQAFEIPHAAGRYCLVERDVPFFEILRILKQSYPPLQASTNNFAELKPYVPPRKYTRQKAESLGIKFIPFDVSLKETIQSFKEKRFIR